MPGPPNGLLGDKILESDNLETLGLDIAPKDLISAHHDRPAVVDGLQEGVAKALYRRWVRDQVGLLIHIGQRKDLSPIRCLTALVTDEIGGKNHPHVQQIGQGPQIGLIVCALVAGSMGDHERASRVQPAGQLDRLLDALAGDDPRWLKQQVLIGTNAKRGPHLGGAGVGLGRRRFEIHHVGDEHRADPGAQGQLAGTVGIDHHVIDGWQDRGKSAQLVIRGRRDLEAFAFPRKVVVMSNGGEMGLCDQLCQGQPQRDVHRDRQGVLDDQQAQVK